MILKKRPLVFVAAAGLAVTAALATGGSRLAAFEGGCVRAACALPVAGPAGHLDSPASAAPRLAGLRATPNVRQPRTILSAAASQTVTGSTACDPALAVLFTPERPVLGRYEVCTDPRPLTEVAPADWTVEPLEAADAFGGAGSYDHAALARLYGGRRARVARGWTEAADRFEAVTLISPYPNATVTTLEPGTLIIRWICDHGGGECKMLNAGR
jgi:hypothetical protein